MRKYLDEENMFVKGIKNWFIGLLYNYTVLFFLLYNLVVFAVQKWLKSPL